MLPEKTYKQIYRRNSFPLYELRSDNIYYEDGLLMYNGLVLDDRNQEGKTLGARRLLTPHKKAIIRKSIFNIIGLLDCTSTMFIDNSGFCFFYKRTEYCDIKSFKITKKISKGTYTLLAAKGVNFLLPISYYPHGKEWVQVLMLGKLPWKLVDVSEEQLPTYRRKI